MSVPLHRRVLRARLDPVRSVDDALAIFDLQITRPLRAETLVMFLDGNSCGSIIVTVTGTDDPFQIVEVAEAMAMTGSGSPDVAALVLASIRPGGGPCPGDDDLWLEVAEVVEASGLTLIDWFVVGRHGTFSPRELMGVPTRWPNAS